MNKIWYFKKENGKIISSFPPLPDGRYKISEVKKQRSPDQNRMYWGYTIKYIITQYKDFGYIYTQDNLHYIFKKHFINRKRIKSDFSKKYIYVIGSTKDLNPKQFSNYIEMIKSIFEFGEMDKIGMERIDSFVIPDINEDELIYRESQIV